MFSNSSWILSMYGELSLLVHSALQNAAGKVNMRFAATISGKHMSITHQWYSSVISMFIYVSRSFSPPLLFAQVLQVRVACKNKTVPSLCSPSKIHTAPMHGQEWGKHEETTLEILSRGKCPCTGSIVKVMRIIWEKYIYWSDLVQMVKILQNTFSLHQYTCGNVSAMPGRHLENPLWECFSGTL